MSLCKTCPHRKVSEGGTVTDGQIPTTRMIVHGREVMELHGSLLHPCHENPALDCRGHERDLHEISQGGRETPWETVTYQVGSAK